MSKWQCIHQSHSYKEKEKTKVMLYDIDTVWQSMLFTLNSVFLLKY